MGENEMSVLVLRQKHHGKRGVVPFLAALSQAAQVGAEYNISASTNEKLSTLRDKVQGSKISEL
jgi:hypothetical protein